MPLSTDVATEILGLPTYASVEDILQRYLTLFSRYSSGLDNSNEELRLITCAFLSLINPRKFPQSFLSTAEMYKIFHNILFGWKQSHEQTEENTQVDEDFDTVSENSGRSEDPEGKKADDKAIELILEEEQEKLKAERRKAKKKRRKERKKQQKSEQELTPEKKVLDVSCESKTKGAKDENSSDSEENIDPSSAFVAVIAKKHKHTTEAKTKDSFVQTLHKKTEIVEDAASVVLRSRQLALRGNEMANLGHYVEAANLFSESIKLDPTDHRFYGNRSYCYDRLGQCERALKDAEKSIVLCPSWPKGYFRKGRALFGLRKYVEAEECFVQVLKLDSDCDDALSELRKAKILQIMERGYTKEQADAALCKYKSVSEALQGLRAGNVSQLKTSDDVDVFISDDESEEFWSSAAKPKLSASAYDIKMDPKNPEQHNSLWIGNVQPDVTEKKLITMFSKYGELISVKVMPEKFCAFVNFKSKASPGKAMFAYQGYELSGAKLSIRFPNLPGETPVKKKTGSDPDTAKFKPVPVNGDECYFWRTTGCIYGEHCRYKHLKEHKGIDKKTWMQT